LFTPTRPGDRIYKVVLFLWFLQLFEPARLLSYYVPPLRPLKWIPELLLYSTVFVWLIRSRKKNGYPWFTAFIVLSLFGTGVAFLYGNWGVARLINRQLLQYYLLALLTLTYINDEKKLDLLFLMYFVYFLYYALWGIYSLKISPINPDVDPAARIIIPWHHQFDNRDGFGTVMGIGLAYCAYYYSFSQRRIFKVLSGLSSMLCIGGIVLSFARGVFIGMGVTLLYIWYKSKKKIIGMLLLIVTIGVVFGAVAFVSSGHNYWEIMNTILTEGSSGGTGADRKTLWGWAWRVFLENPILGAGTGNAGIKFVDIIPENEILSHGYTKGKLWGRAIHCVPLTILADYGLFGAFVFIMLIADFLRTNARTRRALNVIRGSSVYSPKRIIGENNTMLRRYLVINGAISACFVAFWINAIFYETLYSAFLWNLITMNRVLFVNVITKREEQEALSEGDK
jgi:hypothetical protein